VRRIKKAVLSYFFRREKTMMTTQNSKFITELHEKACEVIDILQKLDRHQVYLKFECGSLFSYPTSILKLSESIANNFIAVSRKAAEVPELKAAINSG
jgi:hypothetical protein